MNFEIVGKVIDYIEENYHKELTNDKIENITGKTFGYVRNEFKKIVNMPINEYRIKRELSLIIKEIKENNLLLSNSNLLPWNDPNSFSKAFKNNFGETPMKFIKNYNEKRLKNKFDIIKVKQSYGEDSKIINGLIRQLGNKTNALIYIFSLKPYVLNGISMLLNLTINDIKSSLIRSRYVGNSFSQYNFKKIPRDFYNEHIRLLDKYYDIEKGMSIKSSLNDESFFIPKQYICVKEKIIDRLLEYENLDNIINKNTKPKNLVSIWYEEIKNEEVIEGKVLVPNEFINAGFGMMEWSILDKLILQQQCGKQYETMEELRSDIEYDYDKFIDVYEQYCHKCNYKNKCDDDSDCKYIEELSEIEKEEFYSQPDYEILTMERLCEEIKKLLVSRLVYFKEYN